MGHKVAGLQLLLGRENALDLLEVIEVVAGHHLQDTLDGLRTAFGVHAVVLPLLRIEGLEQHEICFANGAKCLEALTRIAFRVTSSRDPRILIVGLKTYLGP
jgi:hypothetical protein